MGHKNIKFIIFSDIFDQDRFRYLKSFKKKHLREIGHRGKK